MISVNYPDFDFIKKYYDKKCYTKKDVQDYTDGGAITKEEYKKITGDDYPKKKAQD